MVVALAGIGAGATTGAAVVTAGMLVFRLLITAPAPDAGGAFHAVAAVLLVGLAAAAATAWHLGHPIPDTWRRAVSGAIAAFGAVMLALPTAPLDQMGGPPALALYLGALVVAAAGARRRARQAAQP